MKIISGGQTGVDRAALDAAIELGIAHGGWCPKDRLAEDGTIPKKYKLTETVSKDYRERTILNIKDSNSTLILVPDENIDKISDGTRLTISEVKKQGKPYFIVYLSKKLNIIDIIEWVSKNDITVLNIAGPRESQAPGIYEVSLNLLRKIFSFFYNEN